MTEGCGDGVCGVGETADNCPQDCMTCDGLGLVGCCDGTVLHVCALDTVISLDCGDLGCGWDSGGAEGSYNCGFTGEDPAGIFPRSCGCETPKIRAMPRVFNGTTEPTAICLTDGQILAVGAIVGDTGFEVANYCTATLITDDTVLTAAHCLLDRFGAPLNPAEVWFAVGDDVDAAVRVFDIAEVHPHSGYDGEAARDLGVAILAESAVAVLPQIEPIAVNRTALSQDWVGEMVQNVGYGVTQDDLYNSRRWWTAEVVTEVASTEYTVFGSGISSVCNGDSGGPSFYAFDGLAVRIVGTVSWGDPSCVDYDHFCRMDANTSFLDPFFAGYDPCRGLDFTGRCVGDVAQWCEGGTTRQECCPDGCRLNSSDLYRCGDAPPGCGGIDAQGECVSNELRWCDNGTVRRRFCNLCGGGRCEWINDTVGYDCVYD